MDSRSQRDLLLLTEVEKDAGSTQRHLARTLGIALGLTNLYIKRLAQQGYLKISQASGHRVTYHLTSEGVAEKKRLSDLYIKSALTSHRNVRSRLMPFLKGLSRNGVTRIVIYGTGELAQVIYLCLLQLDLTLIGFVNRRRGPKFLSYPLLPITALAKRNFDAVLIAEIEKVDQIRRRIIRAGVPMEKIATL